jgi:threonyl-tRNA synthetase
LAKALDLDLRVTVDNSNQSIGKKIRESEVYKVPYTLVVGEKEIESGDIVPRIREDLKTAEQDTKLSIDKFLMAIAKESKNRISKTSL